MRDGATESWLVSERRPSDLEQLLAVRDAYFLATDLDVPRLAPPVEARRMRGSAMRAELDEAWKREWLRATTHGNGPDEGDSHPKSRWYRTLTDSAWIDDVAAVEQELAAAARTRQNEHLANLARLDAAARRDLRSPRLYTELVADAERRTNAKAGSFRLVVDIVPFSAPVALRVTRSRIVVSESLRANSDAFAATMAVILDDLLTN